MKCSLTLSTASALAIVLSGCSASGTSPQTINSANVAANVLQLNVGTANLFGDLPAAAKLGLNVAVTYRQPTGGYNPGATGALTNSPSFTVPFKLPATAGTADGFFSTIETGPGPTEVSSAVMTSTPQNGTSPTTFGTSGSASGLGIEPYNYSNSGAPDATAPYALPLYDSLSPDPNAFVPFGGKPAFDASGNAANPANAISEGLDIFALTPAIGTYSLSVAIVANTGTTTSGPVSASLKSVAPGIGLLPAIAPATPVLDANGDGGAAFTVALPAGVSEAYVNIADLGPTTTGATSCIAATAQAPVYYTLLFSGSGTASLAAGSLCTAAQNTTASSGTASDGDSFSVQSIGFDYAAFEASYPSSLGKPNPSLAGRGSTGQADVTVSHVAVFTNPSGAMLMQTQSRGRRVR